MDTPIANTFISACEAGNLVDTEETLRSWRRSADGSMYSPSPNADHPLQAGLIAAAEKGHAGIVKLLLASGFRVSPGQSLQIGVRTGSERFVIPDVVLAASASQSAAVFQAMVDVGWDINQSAGLTGDALRWALFGQHLYRVLGCG